MFLLNGAACSWNVKLRSTSLLSLQELEYVADSEACKEPQNFRMLLHHNYHLGLGDPRPAAIYVDNKGAITMEI